MSHMRGGFLTSYLSDLTFPPWFYIVLRERVPGKRAIPWVRWFGASPARAAVSIFLVGVVSEVAQRYWHSGPVAGTFDPLDLAAFAAGLLVCYGIEKL